MNPRLLLALMSGCSLVGPGADRTTPTPTDTTTPPTVPSIPVDDLPPLVLLETGPPHEAEGVDPRVELTLTFDGMLDPNATPGPPVEVRVEDRLVDVDVTLDGATLRVRRAEPWPLYHFVQVTVLAGLTDVDGRATEQDVELEVRIRDGSWMDRADTLAEGVGDLWSLPRSNRRGDVLWPLYDEAAGGLRALRYDASAGRFLPPELVYTGRLTGSPQAGLADDGKGAVTYRHDHNGLEYTVSHATFDGTAWSNWVLSPSALSIQVHEPAITKATFTVFGATVSATDELVAHFRGPVTSQKWRSPTLGTDEDWFVGALPVGDDIVAVTYDASEATLLSHLFEGDSGAGPFTSVIQRDVDPNWFSYDVTAEHNLALTFSEQPDAVFYQEYDHSVGQWWGGRLGTGTRGATLCRNARGERIAAWSTDDELLVGYAAPGQSDFVEVEVGDFGVVFAENADCVLDEAGNGHVIFWGFYDGPVGWSRFRDGRFSPAVQLFRGEYRGLSMDPSGALNLMTMSSGGAALVTRYR